jgi:hypothetical protein
VFGVYVYCLSYYVAVMPLVLFGGGEVMFMMIIIVERVIENNNNKIVMVWSGVTSHMALT